MSISDLPIIEFSISNMQLGFPSPHIYFYSENVHIKFLQTFPRRIRKTTRERNDPVIMKSYCRICTTRTRRLLTSPTELRREAGESMAQKYGALPNALVDQPFKEKSEEEWQRSFDHAQNVPVIDLTREFLEARKLAYWHPDSLWSWKRYKMLQQKRHRMGEYCRSNLDWDWDLSSSLKRLFKINRPKKYPHPEYAECQVYTSLPATINLPMARGGSDRRTLDVTIPEKEPNVLEKIRLRYETVAGEIKYKTFLAVPSVEDISSSSMPVPEPGPCESAQETGELASRARVKGRW